jgi:hypothetical protein
MRLFILLACACGNDSASAPVDSPPAPDASAPVTPADAAPPPPKADAVAAPPVSFAHDVVPLVGNCAGGSCHGAAPTWAYAQLVGVTASECVDAPVALVAPGDPAHSYLLDKLAGHDMCTGVQMPKGAATWGAADLAVISTWIAQGAIDN